MRPYVIEVLIAFAAGCCVGAWANERRHMQESCPIEEDSEKTSAERSKGVSIKLKDGGFTIEKEGKKKLFSIL